MSEPTQPPPTTPEQAMHDFWILERRTLIMRLNYIDSRIMAFDPSHEPTVLSKEERRKYRRLSSN